MKKKFLLFTSFAALSTLVLSSYSGGPAHGGAGNRTGSAGTTANCATGGCHSSNTTATTAAIIVSEVGQTTPITTYVPGRKYAISVGGANSSASLSKFGFQISCVRAAATSTQAGTWGVGTAPNIMAVNVGGVSLMEHMASLNAISTGVYGTSFEWTAPAAGAGTVKFFAMVNIVNADNSTTGDAPNAATLELTQAPTSVRNIAQSISFKAFPSPAVNTLQLEISNAKAGTFDVKVTDMAGRTVLQDKMNATQHGLDVSSLSSGQYIVTVGADGAQGSVRFSK